MLVIARRDLRAVRDNQNLCVIGKARNALTHGRFMVRWMARIVREVTSVAVERLASISEFRLTFCQ